MLHRVYRVEDRFKENGPGVMCVSQQEVGTCCGLGVERGGDGLELRHWFLMLGVLGGLLFLAALLTCRVTGVPV